MRIVITSDLTEKTAHRDSELFDKLAISETNVVVDLQYVKRLDSSGLGSLVSLFKRKLERGLSLKISGVIGQPRELLQEFNLLSLLETHEHTSDICEAMFAHDGPKSLRLELTSKT